ncbi:hypothetical protein BC830DRAFT_1090708 [Chytriomyces sp. MP71]|nr:hypothetical protein BC830DRAFT_1090708 [Chytriomyces sp. MP71]
MDIHSHPLQHRFSTAVALILALSDSKKRVTVGSNRLDLKPSEVLQQSFYVLSQLLGSIDETHRDRQIYALAGVLFCATKPLPFGGSKSKPGYAKYKGKGATTLLQFIISEAFSAAWAFKGRDAIDAVVRAANSVVEVHCAGHKDTIDELLLRGLRKAGHIKWAGEWHVPEALRDRRLVGIVLGTTIEFHVQRRSLQVSKEEDEQTERICCTWPKNRVPLCDSFTQRSGRKITRHRTYAE